MQMQRIILIIIMAVALAGCSSGAIHIPSEQVIDSTGKIITTTGQTVGDASTYRTHEKYRAWRTAYTEYSRAVASSGFQMEFAQVDLTDGTKAWLPSRISFREAPKFVPPADLKDHPVWHTLDTAIRTITPWGFGTWAATSIVGSMESVASRPTQQYSGPVQMSGSYNQAGHDQSVYSGPLAMDNAARDGSPGNQVGGAADSGSDAAIAACIANPPAGTNENGTPMMTPTESCESYYQGQ